MAELNIGVVGIPGKWSTEVLADAVEAKTGFRLVISMESVWADLKNGHLWFNEHDLCQLDALIVKKINKEYSAHTLDRLELLRLAEARGVRVFSGVRNMMQLIDRLSCTMTLSNAGIPMPSTRIIEDVDAAELAVEEFGEAVFKPLYSTKARGMQVLSVEDDDLRDKILAFKSQNPVMYIQRRIENLDKDLGLAFLGGEYLGTYARVSKSGSWNTTIHSGGHYEAYKPDGKVIEMAHKAQGLFKMDFTTVDVVETSEGPMVFEVSAFGGFRGAKEGIGIDVAPSYVKYVMQKLGHK